MSKTLLTGASSVIAMVAALTSAAADLIAPAAVVNPSPEATIETTTPIKHLVVIFNENFLLIYFAAYPTTTNPPGEPPFSAKPGTPAVNNLANANRIRLVSTGCGGGALNARMKN